MEKIVYKLFNEFTKGVDTYTHHGSTWLIFTDTKQWVIELTKDNTLWYNYNFFKGMFSYASMEVVENQHYITKWVEDNIINGVNHTSQSIPRQRPSVDEVIKDGVKEISSNVMIFQSMKVEDAIQNGVKETFDFMEQNINEYEIDDTIQNGVKETKYNQSYQEPKFKDVLENGVKETIDLEMDDEEVVEYIIETKIIEKSVTEHSLTFAKMKIDCEDVIENGVKHTEIGWHQCNNIDDTIEHGMKSTKLPYDVRQSLVEDTIENGVKETLRLGSLEVTEQEINYTIQNGVKIKPALESHEGFKKGTPYVEKFFSTEDIDNTIQNGIKKTKGMDEWINTLSIVDGVIEDGVKDIRPIENDRSFFIEDTIENGIKKISPRNLDQFGIGYTLWKTQTVIEQGINNT